ncbi:hypothetical protein ACF0H5_023476 [Mactra antiquata]
MDLNTFIFRLLCGLVCILEVIVSTAATMKEMPPKFSQNHKLRPERKPNGQKLRSRSSLLDFHVGSNIGQDSMKQSQILEFIDAIRTNNSERTSFCNKSREQTITLGNFSYTFTKSAFRSYNNQTKSGVLMAKYFTDMMSDNVDKYNSQSFSNKNDMPEINSFLRIILNDDKKLAGCGVAFSNKFFPYIYKTEDGSLQKMENFGDVYENFTNSEFFAYHERKKQRIVIHENDLFGKESIVTPDDAYHSQPYFDCLKHRKWLATISLPFYGRTKSSPHSFEFKGVVVLDIDLGKTSINQCENSDSLFSGSHKCRPETTQCKFQPGGGFVSGQYQCQCKPGFYFPVLNATQKFYSGTLLERYFLQSMRSEVNFSSSEFQCLPCQQGCVECDDDGPCMVEYNILMRGIPLGIQSFCMTITLVLGIVVLRVRKCKVMVIGMWCLLEIILLGALFLYATVVVQYFEPSTTTCLIVPWLRELGFAILYGALVLKIYRLLADFQSRKAHRVHVRDKDLLKYLLCIVIVVIGYMAAWTAVVVDQVQDGATLIDAGETPDPQLSYFICRSGWWDYSTEIAEILYLVFGMYLCYRVRAAPCEYREGAYVSATICFECFISTTFYVLRHIYWLSIHPDYIFLMYFLRCQLTVSVTLVLVFGPKLWYAHRPPDERQIRNRAYSDVPDNMAPEVMKLNVGVSSNGDVDVGDVSLADMDPEDIRAELKRLYTQLQVYKTRNMRKDNPHISKRRGGRKQTHRRFSLQAFHHKHRHHHTEQPDHEHEMSRTPEESTNSAEGLPMPIEMNVTKCEEVNENKPTCSVSFRMHHPHK